jgi:hypothetical protein
VWVEWARRARVLVIGIALASTTMGLACVQIDGGAVELSWSIRTFDGCPASCNLRGKDEQCNNIPGADFDDISEVRICWEALGDAGELRIDCGRDPMKNDNSRFACAQEHGVTGFEIPEGATAIWIEPLCKDTGLTPPPDRYEVPAPIVRNITSGAVTTLNALLIVTDPEACAL